MQDTKTNIFALTKQDTAVLKGIAIIAMLMHHIFGGVYGFAESGGNLVFYLGDIGKVCVSIFLFCSGYGLSVGYSGFVDGFLFKTENWKLIAKTTLKFQINRIIRFYASYWPYFIVLVSAGVLLFHVPLHYGEHVNEWKHLFIDFMALHSFGSYCTTWWFNQLILILYFLFPILYWLTKKLGCCLLFLCTVMTFGMGEFSVGRIFGLPFWFLPFILGILWYQKEYLLPYIIQRHWVWGLGVLLYIFIVVFVRQWMWHVSTPGYAMDGFLTLGIVLFTILCKNSFSILHSRLLVTLGKYATGVYLIHMLFFQWMQHYFEVYEWGGGMVFVAILMYSWTLSVIVEKSKKIFGWNVLFEKLLKKIEKI